MEITILPITTIIDKIHPKFMYIDKDTWESFTEEKQNKIKQKIYVLPFNDFITLANKAKISDKESIGLIFHPTSDTEYILLKEQAIGGYNYEAKYISQVLTNILNQKKK